MSKGLKGLTIIALRKDGGDALPDAVGCYIGPHAPLEVDEGVSWRDALAEERCRANALEEALASLGYEVDYFGTVEELMQTHGEDVATLTVDGEPWDLEGL